MSSVRVGRTKSGFKYILSTICYFSWYPDAIPLKKVDEQSVAFAMIKIFSSMVITRRDIN